VCITRKVAMQSLAMHDFDAAAGYKLITRGCCIAKPGAGAVGATVGNRVFCLFRHRDEFTPHFKEKETRNGLPIISRTIPLTNLRATRFTLMSTHSVRVCTYFCARKRNNCTSLLDFLFCNAVRGKLISCDI